MKRILLALAFGAIAMVSRAQTPYYPTIQDTFFGMKMGSKQTVSSIKVAVGYRGTYSDEEYNAGGKELIFADITFAGNTWDYGVFYLTEEGSFYELKVYNSMKDGYSNDDERKDAQNIYDNYKKKLSDKYGESNEKDAEDGKYVIWLGGNKMGVMVSNERNQSKGGDYRRYVSIDYVQLEIYNKLTQKSDDEL